MAHKFVDGVADRAGGIEVGDEIGNEGIYEGWGGEIGPKCEEIGNGEEAGIFGIEIIEKKTRWKGSGLDGSLRLCNALSTEFGVTATVTTTTRIHCEGIGKGKWRRKEWRIRSKMGRKK
jgi:hypothetical protein